MSFWNGSFAKHYDHEHPAGSGPGNFLEHGMDNGLFGDGYQKGDETVFLDYDPITMEPLDEPLEATPLRIEMNGKEYIFFVPGKNPSGIDIQRFFNEWNKAKQPEEGRDPDLMLSPASTETYDNIVWGPPLKNT